MAGRVPAREGRHMSPFLYAARTRYKVARLLASNSWGVRRDSPNPHHARCTHDWGFLMQKIEKIEKTEAEFFYTIPH